MPLINSTGLENLAFIQPNDTVASVENPGHYVVNNKIADKKTIRKRVGQINAAYQAAQKKTEDEEESTREKVEQQPNDRVERRRGPKVVFKSSGGEDGKLPDDGVEQRTGIKLKFGKKKEAAPATRRSRRLVVSCRYRGPDEFTNYRYRGKTYLCPPGKEPWANKEDLKDCFVDSAH